MWDLVVFNNHLYHTMDEFESLNVSCTRMPLGYVIKPDAPDGGGGPAKSH